MSGTISFLPPFTWYEKKHFDVTVMNLVEQALSIALWPLGRLELGASLPILNLRVREILIWLVSEHSFWRLIEGEKNDPCYGAPRMMGPILALFGGKN